MKNKISKVVLAVVFSVACVFCLIAFAACGGKNNDEGNKVDYPNSYEWEYDKEFSDDCDSFMKIDGKLDEDVWTSSERNWMRFTDDNVTVSHTTLFTEKGLYIASVAEDPDLYWSARFNFSDYAGDKAFNSAFNYRIVGEDVNNLQLLSMFVFSVDAKNSLSYEQTRFTAKATTDADIDSGKAKKMVSELFVTWDALNIEVTQEAPYPATVNIIPRYRHINDTSNGALNNWITPLFSEKHRTHTYSAFDENGFKNANVEGAVWGNAGNGAPRSSGWDLSQAEDGIVTSCKGHSQAIFASEVFSDKYIFSVDMTVVNGLKGVDGSDGYFRGGVCQMTKESDFVAMIFDGNELAANVAAITRLKFTGWGWAPNVAKKTIPDYDYNTAGKTVNITVIKNGADFYYLVEGELVYVYNDSTLSGACTPGVYTMSSVAEFSNLSVTDYSDDDAGLIEELEKYAYLINVSNDISGGKINISTGTIERSVADATVDVTILPNQGYVLSSFTVNGEDRTEYVVSNIENGIVTLSVEESLNINATFVRFAADYDLLTIRGELTGRGENVKVSGATVTVYDTENSLFCYVLTTNAQGRFETSFLKPKDDGYEIGGSTYTVGSTYHYEFYAPGYGVISGEIEAEQADEDGIVLLNFDFGNLTALQCIYNGVGNTTDSFDFTKEGETDIANINLARNNTFTDTTASEKDYVVIFDRVNGIIGNNTWVVFDLYIPDASVAIGFGNQCLGDTAKHGHNPKWHDEKNGGLLVGRNYNAYATLPWHIAKNDGTYGTFAQNTLNVGWNRMVVYFSELTRLGLRLCADSTTPGATVKIANIVCATDETLTDTIKSYDCELYGHSFVLQTEGSTAPTCVD